MSRFKYVLALLALVIACPAVAQDIPAYILCPDGRHATYEEQCTPDTSGTAGRGTAGVGGDESATVAEMYATRLKASQEITPGGDAPFGETISLYTGELNFRQTEIQVPGNGPDIVLSRFNSYLGAWLGMLPLPFGNWNASIPRIELLVPTPTVNQQGTVGGNWFALGGGRCTEFLNTAAAWQTWWGGISFIDETGASHEMLARTSGNTAQPSIQIGGSTLAFPIVTQDNWQVGCLPATSNGEAGEAFLAVSPDGTKYWFDYAIGDEALPFNEPDPDGGPPLRFGRMLARMYVTRIEDRFGNYLTYSYTGDKLTSITGSDGRLVNVAWRSDSRRIDTISVVGATTRTWSYGYDTNGTLTGVTLPDASTWTFSNVGTHGGPGPYGESTGGLPWTMCDINGPMKAYPAQFTATVKNPAGLTGTFTTQTIFRGRSYVPSACLQFFPEPAYEGVPSTFGSASLVGRTISGPGVPSATWSYAYTTSWGSHMRDPCASASTCPDTATTTITSPDGNRTVLTYSTHWGAWEGKLLTEQTYQGTSTLLRTTIYEYAEADHGPYPEQVGIAMINGSSTSNVDTQQTWTPTINREIAQQDVTFTHAVAASGLDAFAREIDATDSNTQSNSRQVVTTWHDNTAPWVLGQVATRTVAGVQAQRTDYDSDDQPWKTYAFGKLRQTLTYNTDGTLATAKDGNNNVTTFSSWKRGIPQSIQFPATPAAPSGATRTAVVDNNGWITAVTDENGYSTGYGYDTMGRLASIVYPTGDSTTWNPTTSAFVPVASAEYGIAAGHWRQTVSTGNARKITYFNAQWQPVLSREYDTADVSGTDRYTATAYDTLGRVGRSAYPVATAPTMSGADWPLSGVRTSYDALGRPVSVVQDAETPYGTLTTTTSYGTGFKTTVTNARGKITTSTFQAWDQPATDFPKAITLPEGAYVDIVRDPFGKPTSITRRNSGSSKSIARHMVYDAYQQPCKAIEPETGATVMAYDGAGNLSWSAAGQSLPSESSCDTGSVPASAKVSRSYDARNRLATLSFPDAKGDQAWAYTPDGLVELIETANDTPTDIVSNAYTYNKRRLPIMEMLEVPGQPTLGLEYDYSAAGAMANLTYPDGEVLALAPNALGQPTRAGTYATDVSYYPNGAMAGFAYGNGIVHTLTQNARKLPDRSRDVDGSTSVHDDSYAYDQAGNVLAISDGVSGNRGDRDMTYDDLDRLTDVASPMYGTTGAHYAYDVLDNLTHVVAPGRDHWYCYDASWRLTNVKTTSCSGATVIGLGYDDRGNLQNKSGQVFDFDYGNRLRAAAGVENYRYDGHGRRASAQSALGSVYSFYGQDGSLRYQLDERRGKAFNYISLNGSLLARKDAALTPPSTPAVPTLTVPSTSSTGSYAASWTAETGTTHYELGEKIGSGSWSVIQDTSAISRNLSGKGNGSYSYRVRACNGTGTGNCSGYSTTKTITVSILVTPDVPALTLPGTSSTGSYTASWTAETGATHYPLEEKIGSGSWSSTPIQDTASLSKLVSGKGSGSYSYRVRACAGNGMGNCSAYSTIKTITVSIPVTPDVPDLTLPSTSSTGSYAASWTAETGATHYPLEEKIGSGSWSSPPIQDTSSISRNLSGKTDGSYSYRVRACNGSGTGNCSAYSTIKAITVSIPVTPDVPDLTLPSTSSTGSYTASWTAETGATHYPLEEKIGSGAWSSSPIQDTSAITRNLSGKTDGSYSYRVRACNGSGTGNCSAYSTIKTITVTLPPAVPPTPTLTGQKTVDNSERPPFIDYFVEWTASAGAIYYDLRQERNSVISIIYSGPARSFSDWGGLTRSFWVRACNGSGCSAWSPELAL